MRIFSKILNKGNIAKKIRELQGEMLEGQFNAVVRGTLRIHEEAVKNLQETSRGHAEIRYQPKRIVTVSKPGDPPNTDTGRAVQSIGFDFSKAKLIGRVGTGLKYLAVLEFGSEKNKLNERPWLRPAIKLVSKEIAEIFAEEVRKKLPRGIS